MPAALLAFANDWVDFTRHLRKLLEEAKTINKAFAPLVKAGLDLRPTIHNNATVGVETIAHSGEPSSNTSAGSGGLFLGSHRTL